MVYQPFTEPKLRAWSTIHQVGTIPSLEVFNPGTEIYEDVEACIGRDEGDAVVSHCFGDSEICRL